MKQLKSSLKDLREIFERSITVREIAELLASFDVSCSIDVVKKFMDDKDFDVTVVRQDGIIAGYANKTDLLGQKLNKYSNFKKDETFHETTSLINVLEAFKKLERIFVIYLGQVGGIVTRGDFQKIPVRMWLFGLISLIEMQMLRIIRHCHPDDGWINNISDGKKKKNIENKFIKFKKANAAIDRAECLNLLEKWTIIDSDRDILNKLDIKKGQCDYFFEKLKSLRNILAHQGDIITKDWPVILDLAKHAEDFLRKCEEF